MKILHFADLHLGIDLYGRVDPETGLSTRVLDFLRAFDQIVEDSIEEQIDAVLFAGDAFKNRDPNPTLQREFAKRIARLTRAQIPIVLLMGNHDLPGIDSRATAAEIYQVLEVGGVHVAREIDILTLDTKSGPLQVVTLPWVTRSRLMTAPEFRQFADQEQQDQLAEGVSYQLYGCTEELDPELPKVLLAHITMQGAEYGHERSIMLGEDVMVDGNALRVSSFDYVALGHIHKHQLVRSNPPVIYAGSPERVDFGEEKEQKGYVLVNINQTDAEWRADWEFRPLDARRFVTIRFSPQGENIREAVQRAIQRQRKSIEGSIVRCFVNLEAGTSSQLTGRDVRAMLEEMAPHYIGQVVVQAEQAERSRYHVETDEALDAGKMLTRWLESRDYDPEFSKHVQGLGQKLIRINRDRSILEG